MTGQWWWAGSTKLQQWLGVFREGHLGNILNFLSSLNLLAHYTRHLLSLEVGEMSLLRRTGVPSGEDWEEPDRERGRDDRLE